MRKEAYSFGPSDKTGFPVGEFLLKAEEKHIFKLSAFHLTMAGYLTLTI
jgi:hypothetical protein